MEFSRKSYLQKLVRADANGMIPYSQLTGDDWL